MIVFASAHPARAGTNLWTTHGPDGGPVVALAIDPSTPSTLYAGTFGAGVFKSTDSGVTWSAANSGLPANAIVQALAIDPSTPTTLYAGTAAFLGVGGVFKSTDGGGTWSAADTGPSAAVHSLAIDPSTPRTLYAGTFGGGVFKSTDGGATWSAPNLAQTAPMKVYALVIDPQTPSTLYAATDERPGVFKSTDSGATWTVSNSFVPDPVYSLAIDPQTPSTLYAGTLSGGVVKSTDSGATWSAVYNRMPDGIIYALAIDPSTPDTLYAGTYAGPPTNGGALFKSTDSGGTWSAVTVGLPKGTRYFHALAIDPSSTSTLYAGNVGGGVFKSTDSGATWNAANTGLIAASVLVLAIDPSSSSTLYAGTDGDGVFKSTDSGGTWSAANTGLDLAPVTSLVIDPETPSTIYAGTNGGGVFKSTDSGGTWNAANTGLTVPIVTSLAIDPIIPNTLYAGTGTFETGGVFKSTDGGVTWSDASAGLLPHWVTVLAINPSTPNTLYAGINGGAVYKTTDGGGIWSVVTTGLDIGVITALAIDPSTPSTLYFAGGGVYKSTDSGGTWSAASSDLLGNGVSALAIEPSTGTTLYAGTYSGDVFKSTDGGGTWSAASAGLPNYAVQALAIDPSSPSTLYAGMTAGVFDIEQVAMVPCVGDCNGGRQVTIDELLTLVNIALGEARAARCPHGIPSGAAVHVALLIQAVNDALSGCSETPTTAAPTGTVTPAATRTNTSMPMSTGTPTGSTRTPTRSVTMIPATPTRTLNVTLTPSQGNFVDNGDGTITDTRTGLTWEKKDQAGGLHDVNAQYVWEGVCNDNTPPTVPPGASKNQASASVGEACQPDTAAAGTCSAATQSPVGCAQCSGSLTCEGEGGLTTIWHWLAQLNAARFAGHSDWRVPTAGELKTILDGGAPGCIGGAPCVPSAFDTACTAGCTAASCSCTRALYYWSATTTSEAGFPGPGYAWIVSFMLGTWDFEPKCGGTYLPLVPYVRAVRGAAIPTPTATPTETPAHGNFIDNGDGTITDTQRGLMWEKKDASGGLHDENALHAWACLSPDAEFICQPDAAAAATCSAATGGADGCGQCPRGVPCNPEGFTTIWEWLNQLNATHFAGYSDWRIPTVGDEGGAAELETIVDAGAPRCADPSRSAACVPAQFDTACMPGCSVASCSCANGDTWSSISVPASPFAWEVEFKGGPLYAENKDSNRFVRAVRGAPSPATTATPIPTPIPGNFVDNGDGTITDTRRGLTWEKKDVSYNDSGSTGGGAGSHDARGRYEWAGWCNDNSGYCQPDAAAASTCAAATGGAVGCAVCGGVATCHTHSDYTLWQWLNQLNAASFAGHSDWRLPTVSELETIVDASGPACGSGTPCVPAEFGGGRVCEGECSATYTAGCSCTQAGLSWSATSFASHSTSAWLVNFGTGGAEFLDKTLNYYVRAVRAGS